MYSLNGQYPQPLPYRIRLSNGLTRTGSYTAEEIADAGYVEAPDPPSITRHEILSWYGTQWVVTDPRTLESAKELRLQDLKAVRQSSEKNFTWNGTPIYLDDKTQSRLDAGLKGLELSPSSQISWEVTTGVFVDFNLASMQSLALAAWNHIRLCFINAKTITTQINNCTTIAEIDAVDIEVGWPT
jgi:hypothetical protein